MLCGHFKYYIVFDKKILHALFNHVDSGHNVTITPVWVVKCYHLLVIYTWSPIN